MKHEPGLPGQEQEAGRALDGIRHHLVDSSSSRQRPEIGSRQSRYRPSMSMGPSYGMYI
jgi:hypothetical protein